MILYKEEISELRKEINRLNVEILEKLVERVEIARKIGAVKKRHGFPIINGVREAEIFQQIRKLSKEQNLNPIKVERIFREIVRLCTEVELEDEG